MKHGLKRALALLFALMLAMPGFAYAEEPVDDIAAFESQTLEDEMIPTLEIDPSVGEADEGDLPDFTEEPAGELPTEEAPQADPEDEETWDFIGEDVPAEEPSSEEDPVEGGDTQATSPVEEDEVPAADRPAEGEEGRDEEPSSEENPSEDPAEGDAQATFPVEEPAEGEDAQEPSPEEEPAEGDDVPEEGDREAEEEPGEETDAEAIVEADADIEEEFTEEFLEEAVEEDIEEVEAYADFLQSQTVDGVTVTVSAPMGAFPEDARLSVTKVPADQAQQAEQAVDAAMNEEQPVVAAYTFDICILDADGNELQPAEGCEVQVSFALAEVVDEGLVPSIYHMSEDGGAMTAEALTVVEESGDTVTAVTEGFSLFTIALTEAVTTPAMNAAGQTVMTEGTTRGWSRVNMSLRAMSPSVSASRSSATSN